MSESKYILITGAAGFIGSVLVSTLNNKGYNNLVLVDDFSRIDKASNLINKKYNMKVHRDQLFDWLDVHGKDVSVVFHIGAKTDTTLTDRHIFKHLNVNYTKQLFEYCTEQNIAFYYASSAATYGNGELGYDDNIDNIPYLKPLNEYAKSKQDIDIWLLEQSKKPSHWAGFKFFNVYGPNEYHKGRMASVVFHAYRQILQSGAVTLFKSHHPDYKDGEQIRDFIYVKDVVNVLIYFMEQQPPNDIYNLGTGNARTFNDLVNALFNALNHPNAQIKYIDTPENIRANYQYYTEANMDKLISTGYVYPFYTLEDGVRDYALHYLEKENYL